MNLGQISNTIQTTLAGAERVFGVLAAPEEPERPDVIDSEDGIKGEFFF